MIKKEIPPKPIIIALLTVISGAVFHFCDKSNSNTGDQSIKQKEMSGTTIYNIIGDVAGNIIFPDLRSEGDHDSELAKREQMREQEREKDLQIGIPTKETTNVALNRPVVGVYLEVKKVDGSESGKSKKGFALAVDGRRLSSFVRYHEQYSINSGGYACNLTDGRHRTRVWPSDFAFDYVVDLLSIYDLSEIILVWGNKNKNEITSWELYGQDSFSIKDFPSMEDWELIVKGGTPGQKTTRVPKEFLKKPMQRLRIRARSESIGSKQASWIGMYEIEAYGTPLNSN